MGMNALISFNSICQDNFSILDMMGAKDDGVG